MTNPVEYRRMLNLPGLLSKKSFFLFGPRATGKTYLIRKQLSELPRYDLLDAATFSRLSRRPALIGEENSDPHAVVVIDEIQKLPSLLNEVHRLIEERSLRFLLTGSSARKLKRGSANMLAGRAWQANLFPLVSAEIDQFDLERHLLVGGLPVVYPSKEPWEELNAYVGTYLQEEIQAEALVRNLDSFVSFLDIAATKVAEEVNYESVGSDCGVSGNTVKSFFQILEDTLIGFRLAPFRKTKIRKAVSRPKFYLFDNGVTNVLMERREIPRRSDAYGNCFEQFVILEVRAYLSYRRRRDKLAYWRSRSGHEVDCVIGDRFAVEVKSTSLVHERHLSGLRALQEEGLIEKFCIVSHDETERIIDGIKVYPWKRFLELLWQDELF